MWPKSTNQESTNERRAQRKSLPSGGGAPHVSRAVQHAERVVFLRHIAQVLGWFGPVCDNGRGVGRTRIARHLDRLIQFTVRRTCAAAGVGYRLER